MGILGTLFRKKKAFPSLDPSSAAAARVAAFGEQLEPFVRKVHVALELVPAHEAVYVYLGNPPADFGMAWFEQGREVSFASLKQDQGLSQGRIQVLAKRLGAAYAKSAGAVRCATTIAGRDVVVTLSDELAAEIRKAIDEAVS